jgi:hypothetical protein
VTPQVAKAVPDAQADANETSKMNFAFLSKSYRATEKGLSKRLVAFYWITLLNPFDSRLQISSYVF